MESNGLSGMKGNDGFIDRDGKFHPTKPSMFQYFNGSFDCHEQFAQEYADELGIDTVKQIKELGLEDDISLYSKKDWLVHIHGWVSITTFQHDGSVYFCVPRYSSIRINKSQSDTLVQWTMTNHPNDSQTLNELEDAISDQGN